MQRTKCAGGCGNMGMPNGLNGYIWVTDYNHGERRYFCKECDAKQGGYPNGLCHLVTKEEHLKTKAKRHGS